VEEAVTTNLLAPAPDLEPWQAQVGSLRIGPGTPYDFGTLDGVDEMPELRTSDVPRPWAHGVWAGDDFAEGRTIEWTLEAQVVGSAASAALAALRRVMVPTKTGQLVSVWFNLPPRSALLRWDVRIRKHRMSVDQVWVRGQGATAEAMLFAPDPIGYGPGRTASTSYVQQSGGLEFPLFSDGTDDTGWLEFGEAGSQGTIVLGNQGTADTWPLFAVDGPVVGGFQIVDQATGRVLEYSGDVADGSTLTLDAAQGTVMLDGVADRSTLLTRRQWSPVPANGGTTVTFLPLASHTDATLHATWAPGWW
jgi:hypothetical protein